MAFACLDPDKFLAKAGLSPDGSAANVLIWTTTPWTLPANLGIALHPDFDYRFFRLRGERVLLAERMAGAVAEALGTELKPEGERVSGKVFEGLACRHPFIDRKSAMVLADYVTLDAGTGCVHTAPGHGGEDFVTGQKYGLDAYAPVDADGRFTDEVERWAGLSVWKANEPIVALLHETGRLATSRARRSCTAIRIAGAARSRSSSAPLGSGSSPWTPPASAPGRWRRSARSPGSRRGARTASAA